AVPGDRPRCRDQLRGGQPDPGVEMSAVQTAPRPASRAPQPRPTRPRKSQAGVRLWDATPMTRITLVIAVVLSFFPLWWMIVVASRDNSAATQFPPPMLPGGNLWNNLE